MSALVFVTGSSQDCVPSCATFDIVVPVHSWLSQMYMKRFSHFPLDIKFRLTSIYHFGTFPVNVVWDVVPKDMEKNVIYTIKCGTCDEEYVGETKRFLATRIKEHQDATRLDQCSKSAVAEHAHEHDIPHNIDWKSAKVIDRGKSKFNIERKMREAFHIHLRQPGMRSEQQGQY